MSDAPMSRGKRSDREVGMDRAITRRDFVQGAVAGGAALALGCSPADSPPALGPTGAPAASPLDPIRNPAARHGLRGSHAGSFETAHELVWHKRNDWAPVAEPDDVTYDLVVVGTGVSGLAAARFYQRQHPDARILLLDNHDDFGGHAKRNEFQVDGQTVLGYGGSQSLESPGAYSEEANELLADIGVEPRRLADAYDLGFFLRHGLGAGIYFDTTHYGEDRLIRSDLIDTSLFIPTARAGTSPAEDVSRMPISEAAQRELLALLNLSEDRLADQSIWAEPEFLSSLSYRDFLTKHLGVKETEVLELLHDMPSGYFGQGIDCVPALDALSFGLPGLGGTSLGRIGGLLRTAIKWSLEPYIYHFPDGNASVARLLVRRLIPAVADGSSMDDVLLAPFDYSALDRPESSVRLRLSSTVVRVEHAGPVREADDVAITYVRAGRGERVRARHVVLACYNTMVPHLCPELPDAQKTALRAGSKVPLVYTNVLLGRWEAFVRAGVGVVHSPGSWHQAAMLDFPVSQPGYRHASDPSQPIVLHMNRVPTTSGVPPREQSRIGRVELLLGTSFERIEREIRNHLAGMLGPFGFDPVFDIEGIVVNRWPHGYAFEPNPLFDPEMPAGEALHEIGRRPFGRIAIANSDSGGRAYLDCAIDQAWRAVGELTG
jgi:spermidine dehydrogenase